MSRINLHESKKRRYLKEGEILYSPTVLLEELFTVININVYEGRDVAIFEDPGTYLHTEIPIEEIVLLKL